MAGDFKKPLAVKKPWGQFEQFTKNEATTVKILTVEPGKRLSYQSHKKRDEFWRCIKGKVAAVVESKGYMLNEGGEIFIKKGKKHRLIGTYAEAQVLEISFGEFDEEDIERFEDDYGRKGTSSV